MASTTLSPRDKELLAMGWDAAVAAMRYEDGSPVEIVNVVNPFRPSPVTPESEKSE